MWPPGGNWCIFGQSCVRDLFFCVLVFKWSGKVCIWDDGKGMNMDSYIKPFTTRSVCLDLGNKANERVLE